MAKAHTQFICQRCGRITAAYVGKCPQCGEFGTMVEQIVSAPARPRTRERLPAGGSQPLSQPQQLSEVSDEGAARLRLPMDEFARVLGGGLVPGSIILVGGEPGIGKSTLLLQVAAMIAASHGPTLYVSGEESVRQIKLRANRMDINTPNLYLVTETNLETIWEHIDNVQPTLLVVDSIQTTYTGDLDSSSGSISQVRECASRFQELAKNAGITVVLVGHVTKEGNIAGPRVLEHIVDTVLYLEGDPFHRYRLLRSVKNRFGATNEVGVFEMVQEGMVEVPNPSQAFLAERQVHASGSCIAVTMEGTRPLLIEIQALVTTSSFSNPRRTANGIDYNRLLLLAAVVGKRAGLRLHDKDIFVNVVGGLRIGEPAADLAVALAIISAFKDRPIHADMALVGEIGLSGELRTVGQMELRLREVAKLGFRRCLLPKPALRGQVQLPPELEAVGCRSIREAVDLALLSQSTS